MTEKVYRLRANTYTNSGKYSDNYNTGNLYDTLF